MLFSVIIHVMSIIRRFGVVVTTEESEYYWQQQALAVGARDMVQWDFYDSSDSSNPREDDSIISSSSKANASSRMRRMCWRRSWGLLGREGKLDGRSALRLLSVAGLNGSSDTRKGADELERQLLDMMELDCRGC